MDLWSYIFWVAVATVAVLLLVSLIRYRVKLLKFFREVQVELSKCSWPWDPNQNGFKRYRELIESTVVVVVCTILLAGFVTTSDLVLAHAIGFLTGATVSH